MKYVCLLVILLLAVSCDHLNVKKTSSEEILNEELRTFKWNEVDVYPTFTACDSSATKIEKKVCFETLLTDHLANYLASQSFVVSQDVNDTLLLTFTISDKGEALITDIKIKEETILELTDIKNILKKSLDSLPEIFPAIKRGQQVTSQFKMPIVISVN